MHDDLWLAVVPRSLRFESQLALRHLRSGGRQTLLTISAVAAGVIIVVFVTALIFGLQRRWTEILTDALPHVTIRVVDPKPLPQVYDRFLSRHGVDPRRAAMFEDLARNLEVPHALGMTTVLVVPEKTREVFREGWELEGRDAPHVSYVTDDLARFLRTNCWR